MLRAVASCAALLWLLAAAPAHALKDTPFPPGWAARVEQTFFEDGELSIARLTRYREQLAARRDELAAVLAEHYRERGKGEDFVRKRVRRKKEIQIYDRILGRGSRSGLLDELWDETDPSSARILASRILELDHALRVEGERPFSLNLFDYLTWASIRNWVIDPRSHADRVDREASNLWNPEAGAYYDTADLRALIEAGGDISALDPLPDGDFWQLPRPVGQRSVRRAFYGGRNPLYQGRPIYFPPGRARLAKIRKSQTKPKFEIEIKDGGSRRGFKLKVGGEIHSEPTAGALLATLGFNVDVTRYVRDFRLDLGDTSTEELRHEWRSYFESHRTIQSFSFDDYFVEGEDEEGRFLMVREGVIEAKPRTIVRVGPWPFGGNGNEGRREVRGLGLFSVWIGNTDLKESENNKIAIHARRRGPFQLFHIHHDLGHSFGRMMREQINAFPWKLVRRLPNGKIWLNYHSVQPTSLRKMITGADARWMTRLIAQLSRRQIAEAVAIGHWPRPVQQLLVEKLIARRNQLVEAFGLEGERTPSGRIRILRVVRDLSTPDGEVVDGELTSGRFPGATQQFGNYWEALLGPVLDKIALWGVAQLQRGISQVPELIFDTRSVGLPLGLVSELLLSVQREIDENRQPESSREYFIARDTLQVGARLGGGFVGRGEAAYYRRWTLLTPVGTEREAVYANGTVLDVLLPWKNAREKLPERFVLIRETYLDGRARAITDDLSRGAFPLGAETTLTRARLSRDIVSVRGERVNVYRDLSWFDEAAYRAFVKAVFVRIPFLKGGVEGGQRAGELFSLSRALREDGDAATAALSDFLRDGDPRGLDAVADRLDVDTEYVHRRRRASIIDFLWKEHWDELDAIQVIDPRAEVPILDAFTQHRIVSRHWWSFLDFRESYKSAVNTVSTTDAGAAADPASSDALEPARVLLLDNDRNTASDELGRGYIATANAIASAGGRRGPDGAVPHVGRIHFSPEAHSTNARWGHTVTRVDIGFSTEAVRRLLALDAEAYWREFATRAGVSPSRLRAWRAGLAAHGKRRLVAARRIPPGLRRAVLHSTRLLARLRAGRTAADPAARMQEVARALAEAALRRGGAFDPTLLATLRALLGAEHVSVDVRVTQPPWREKRLLAGADLVLHTHARPFGLPRPPLIFRPHSAIDEYDMLDSFSRATFGRHGRAAPDRADTAEDASDWD